MFKLIFKPIKWILGIVLFFVILLITPLLFLYKPAKKPEFNSEGIDFKTYINEQIDLLIDEDNLDKTLGIHLTEELINTELNNRLIEQFGESDNPDYLFEDENIMFQGAWTKLSEKKLDVIIGVHANARILTYKTQVLMRFKIINEQDGNLILKLDKFRIGHVTFKWAIKHAPKLVEKFLGQNVDEFIESSLQGIGTYNSKKMELKINLYDLTDKLDENKELGEFLLDVIYENELLDFGILKHNDKYNLGLTFNLNKIENTKQPFVLDQNEKFNDDEEFMNYLKNKALAGMLSTNSSIKFNSLDMNKIIDFIFNEGNNNNLDYLMKQDVYEDYEMKILNPYVDINNNKLMLNVPIRFGKDNNYFKTTIEMHIELSKNNDDLIIELIDLNLGELLIDNNKIETVLQMLDVENFNDTKILVDDFFKPFKESNIDVTSINITNNVVNFNFEGLTASGALNDINDEINDPDLNNQIDNLLDKIDNGEEITEEDLEDLIDALDNLDEEDLDKIDDILGDYLP